MITLEGLEERQRFMQLLSEISSCFINLPADRIDGKVEDVQRRICEILHLDRSTLWQALEGEPGIMLVKMNRLPESPQDPERIDVGDRFPWTLGKVLGGETLVVEDLADLPPEAGRDRDSFRAIDARSIVVVPLSVGEGPVTGMLSFSLIRGQRRWTETAVKSFEIIARMFANAFARSRAEKVLGDRLRFELLVSDLSARFLAVPFDQVDSEINQALGEILAFFQVDRCGLIDIRQDMARARVTHAAYGESIEPVSGEIDLADLFPWSYGQLIQGRPINVRRLEDYPADALRDRQSHAAIGNQSVLNIPVAVGGRVSRTIVIIHTRRQQVWPEAYIPRLRLLGEVFANALVRRENQLELEGQLRFERLLAETSAHFVDLPADQVDGEIVEAQRRVCECLGLDLSALWQWKAETPGIGTMTHLYRPLGGPPPPDPMNTHEYFPWCQQQVEAGRTVVVPSLEALPPEAARDREVWRHFGIKTSLTFPLSAGGGPIIGALSFNTMREERTWPELVVQRLQLVAQMFTQALVRKKAETALRESEARLSLATEAVGAGLWILEVDSQKVWVSPQSRELFQFAPDEEVRYASYFRVIHPEDRERVDREVQQALQSGERLRCDYRILLPDGTLRWIAAHGQRYLKAAGEPVRLMGLSLDITKQKEVELQIKAQLDEIGALQQRLERENVYLKEEIRLLGEHAEIVGQSAAIRKVLSKVEQVARTGSTVLLLGETGTGKELAARAIHGLSSRKDRPLVTVNCAALPPTLMECELFGREKGAYTGALTRMVGRFELADGSTLFLDEIGEIPLELQSKLLRVLEEGSFERLGSTKPVRVDVRIIAATNRDLEQDVKDGKFRRDLYYRLNVFPIVIPPLRERPEDIPSLVRSIVKEFQKRMGKEIESIPRKTLQDLQAYPWPGNVRELRNLIEHAMILSNGKVLEVHLPRSASPEAEAPGNLQEMERTHVAAVLEKTGWRIAGPGGAAEALGLKRTTLLSKMKKLGIRRSNKPMSK
ncbi:MAG: sigma 54-interacting transcriptional regulator [Acidobacteria bacterium]|nr:sigma 54-interacting transcriptional regulator [Acidobacteriota bacterium]